MLVVGDSTGVGTGASQPVASVAGLLGAAYPHLLVPLYDGDPFEYTTHCIGTVVSGALASSESR